MVVPKFVTTPAPAPESHHIDARDRLETNIVHTKLGNLERIAELRKQHAVPVREIRSVAGAVGHDDNSLVRILP